jgi:hypothetical protein
VPQKQSLLWSEAEDSIQGICFDWKALEATGSAQIQD